MKLYSEEAYDNFIACKFIQVTDHIRIRKLEVDLANPFSLGVNNYLWYLSNATNVLIVYKNYDKNPNQPGKKKLESKKDS